MPTNAPLSQVPEEISKDFRILQLLSRGGHGSVYLAEDRALGNLVAIKMLRLDIDEQTGQIGTRLRQEARTLARLHHPHIVTIHRLILPKGAYPALVMEYVEGPTLTDVMAHECPLDLHHLRMIFIPIAQALHYAHTRGVVHRDIKPSNILIRWEDLTAKLVDFSIAWSEESAGLTKTSTIIGTPHYMSPEQSDSLKLDYHSDIYSLGVVLYECACGRLPFYDRSDWRVLRMHVETPAPRPTSTEGELPEALVELILQCLSKSPAQRPESAEQIARTLDAILPTMPGEGYPPMPASCFNPGQGQRALVRGTDSALIRKGLTPPGGTPPDTPHSGTPESDSETFAYTQLPLKIKPVTPDTPPRPTPSTPSQSPFAQKSPSTPAARETVAPPLTPSATSRPLNPDSDQHETTIRPSASHAEINQLQTIVLDEEQRAMIEKGIDPDAEATSPPNSLGVPDSGAFFPRKAWKVALPAAAALIVILGILAATFLRSSPPRRLVDPATPVSPTPTFRFEPPTNNEIRSHAEMIALRDNSYLLDDADFGFLLSIVPGDTPDYNEAANQASFQLSVSSYGQHIVDVWLEEYRIQTNEDAQTTETLAVYRHVAESASERDQKIVRVRVEIADANLLFRRLGVNRPKPVPLRFLLSSRAPIRENPASAASDDLPFITREVALFQPDRMGAGEDIAGLGEPDGHKETEMLATSESPTPSPSPSPSSSPSASPSPSPSPSPTPHIIYPPEFRIYKHGSKVYVWVATSPVGEQEPDFMASWSEKAKKEYLFDFDKTEIQCARDALYKAGEISGNEQKWHVSEYLLVAKGLPLPFEITGVWQQDPKTMKWHYDDKRCSILRRNESNLEPKALGCEPQNNIDGILGLPPTPTPTPTPEPEEEPPPEDSMTEP